MRVRDAWGQLLRLGHARSTNRRCAAGLDASSPAGTDRRSTPGVPGTSAALVSPTEQIVLEAPALRARRLVRLQIAAIVVVSIGAALLGILAVALPPEDRSLALLALAVVVGVGGLFVGFADYVHGRCLQLLIGTASELRQSAAERAAELARSNAELRQRDAERASLVAIMSHELRTPLSAIIGFSRELLDEVDGDLNEEQRTDLRIVHQSGTGLLGIVNRTLDFARLDAGSVTMAPGPVQLRSIFDDVVATLRPLAAAQGLDLSSTVQPGMPPVHADEDALRQILANLVGNAVKFTDSGRISLHAERSGPRVTIAVTDTGPGIPQAEHERIFEPFHQLDSGIVRGAGGTGLGLAICQRLAHLMNGRIWVESETGRGSTFFLALPIAELHRIMPTGQNQSGAVCDVAIVGDPIRTGPLAASLRSHGLDVTMTHDSEGLRELGTAAPRLVLFDAHLPRLDAWRGLAKLRATGELSRCRAGLVGLADGGGRVVAPTGFEILTDTQLDAELAARLQGLLMRHSRDRALAGEPVLILGGDMGWRRRVGLLLEARGLCTTEARTTADAISLVQRVHARGIVVDLLLPDPGIADLLDTLHGDEVLRSVPVIVVGPDALSPGQQHDLRANLVRWSRHQPVPVSDLARAIAETVAERARVAVTV